MQMNKLKIKKGDTVTVITGEYKGHEGRVLAVLRDKKRVLVEGVNIVSRHTKPDAQNPEGGIVKKEGPIHLSNVALVDPSSGKPTKIGRRLNDNGKLVRYAKKSGEEIK